MSVCPPVRPSVRMEQLGSHWTYFREILYEGFRKSVEKIQVSLKSDMNNGYFTGRLMYMYHISLNISQNEKYFRQKLYWKSKHNFYVQQLFFLKPWRFWDNVEKYSRVGQDTDDNTGCKRRNGPDFGRVLLMLNYTEKPQNTYIQSWTVSEIMASEFWNFDSCYTPTDYQIHIETGRNMWFL